MTGTPQCVGRVRSPTRIRARATADRQAHPHQLRRRVGACRALLQKRGLLHMAAQLGPAERCYRDGAGRVFLRNRGFLSLVSRRWTRGAGPGVDRLSPHATCRRTQAPPSNRRHLRAARQSRLPGPADGTFIGLPLRTQRQPPQAVGHPRASASMLGLLAAEPRLRSAWPAAPVPHLGPPPKPTPPHLTSPVHAPHPCPPQPALPRPTPKPTPPPPRPSTPHTPAHRNQPFHTHQPNMHPSHLR